MPLARPSFRLFGNPSASEPWGFTLFGHHLCLNIFVQRGQMSISPAFIGAEPNVRPNISTRYQVAISLLFRRSSIGAHGKA